MKPVLAVDIDGTLGNYHDHFTNFCCMYFQREFDFGYVGEQENFEDFLGLTREDYRAAKLAYRQGGMKRSMVPYSGAARLLDMAAKLDVEVWVATTRPYQRLDNIDPDTRFWMSHWNFKYHAMLYGDDKYDQLNMHVDNERVIMLIDDLHSQVVKADKIWGTRVWMVERKHNGWDRQLGFEGMKWLPQCLEMDLAADALYEAHHEWEAEHAH